jgi:hypothetical protein
MIRPVGGAVASSKGMRTTHANAEGHFSGESTKSRYRSSVFHNAGHVRSWLCYM